MNEYIFILDRVKFSYLALDEERWVDVACLYF